MKSQRLKSSDFEKILKLVPKKYEFFDLYVRRNTGSQARLGMVVSKRFLFRAIDRNRLRRRIRAQFKAAGMSKDIGLDVIFRVRRRLSSAGEEITNDMLLAALGLEFSI